VLKLTAGLPAGEPGNQIARDYDLNPSSLHRHRVNCLGLSSSNVIMKEAARGTAAIACLPSVEELGVREGTRNPTRGWQAALPYLEAPGGTHVPAAASTALPPSYMTPSVDTDTRAGPFNVSSWLAL
jgi:hypothetical protein